MQPNREKKTCQKNGNPVWRSIENGAKVNAKWLTKWFSSWFNLIANVVWEIVGDLSCGLLSFGWICQFFCFISLECFFFLHFCSVHSRHTLETPIQKLAHTYSQRSKIKTMGTKRGEKIATNALVADSLLWLLLMLQFGRTCFKWVF